MATSEEMLRSVDEVLSHGARRGVMHNQAEDTVLDGRHITIHGRRMVNFGSCSYLGLETHAQLKAAVHDAVDRYGTQFSSSRAYTSSPLYEEAEETLSGLFGRPTVITPSTSMGHVAAMPTLIGAGDVLVLDHQVHHSVQTAAKLAQAAGARVELIPHNDLRTLERKLAGYRKTHRRVWYAADGLYSMYADFLPAQRLNELAEHNDNLWLYVDDAHAVSWTGQHGRGYALEQLTPETLDRTVVAASLNKSFAAAGGAITLPNEELRRQVFTVGGPMIFSGPVQPPMLGAILASARLHLTSEVADRQRLLLSRIRLFNRLSTDAGLPLVSESEAPIRCVGAGVTHVAYRLTERLRECGYAINTAIFPAVPAKRCGARVTITAHHTEEDIVGVVEALADQLPAALADEGATAEELHRAFGRQLAGRPVTLRALPSVLRQIDPTRTPEGPDRALRLEHHTTIATVDPAEWNALLGSRGAFDVAALRTLETVFGTGVGAAGQTEDVWDFHYWIVRDAAGAPVAATFFTTALWKDDMLSPAHVSREVERRRAEAGQPNLLTSPMVAMGSLLSEGDHLYRDLDKNWRGALKLILAAARAVEDDADATGLLLRDLPDQDAELHEFLLGEGFARIPIWNTWVREIDFPDDAAFLDQLSRKKRQHQRRNVLPWEPRYRTEVVAGGSAAAAAISSRQRDEMYRMYRNVHARSLELNVFPLPRRIIDAVLDSPGWEVVLLHLPELDTGPVALGVLNVTQDRVATVFLGLDYRYVASHHSYQQLLLQALRSAQRHGAPRVHYGMSAELQKSRFGAHPEKRWAYVQATETYNADVLAQLTETIGATPIGS